MVGNGREADVGARFKGEAMSTTGDPMCKRCGGYLIALPGPLCSRCDRDSAFQEAKASVFKTHADLFAALATDQEQPAAGPWIRVDSGERPEEREGYSGMSNHLLVLLKSRDVIIGWFDFETDTWRDSDHDRHLNVTHWARVRLPGEEP